MVRFITETFILGCNMNRYTIIVSKEFKFYVLMMKISKYINNFKPSCYTVLIFTSIYNLSSLVLIRNVKYII